MRVRGQHRTRGDAGQAVPLAAGLVVVAATLVLGLGVFGRDVGDIVRARSAADAAALAAVTAGGAGATRLAAANGATLVTWHRDGADVVVTVRVGRATATARATGGDTAGAGG